MRRGVTMRRPLSTGKMRRPHADADANYDVLVSGDSGENADPEVSGVGTTRTCVQPAQALTSAATRLNPRC